MPNEEIGTCGDAQWPDREAIAAELEFGIACLRRHCGDEPAGSSLEVVWHDHDSGAYATISLVWEQGSLFEKEWEYIERCQETLDQLDACVDWEAFHAMRHAKVGPTLAVSPESPEAAPAALLPRGSDGTQSASAMTAAQRPWRVGLLAALVFSAGVGSGFLGTGMIESREERLARRYVLAERAWRQCTAPRRELTFDDLLDATKPPTMMERARETIAGLFFTGQPPGESPRCEREGIEFDIAHEAIRMARRLR